MATELFIAGKAFFVSKDFMFEKVITHTEKDDVLRKIKKKHPQNTQKIIIINTWGTIEQ